MQNNYGTTFTIDLAKISYSSGVNGQGTIDWLGSNVLTSDVSDSLFFYGFK